LPFLGDEIDGLLVFVSGHGMPSESAQFLIKRTKSEEEEELRWNGEEGTAAAGELVELALLGGGGISPAAAKGIWVVEEVGCGCDDDADDEGMTMVASFDEGISKGGRNADLIVANNVDDEEMLESVDDGRNKVSE
jgi:hypothetical protein